MEIISSASGEVARFVPAKGEARKGFDHYFFGESPALDKPQ